MPLSITSVLVWLLCTVPILGAFGSDSKEHDILDIPRRCYMLYHSSTDGTEPCPRRVRPAPNPGGVCRPEYFIAGTRKGGTTAFHTFLAHHPDVYPFKLRPHLPKHAVGHIGEVSSSMLTDKLVRNELFPYVEECAAEMASLKSSYPPLRWRYDSLSHPQGDLQLLKLLARKGRLLTVSACNGHFSTESRADLSAEAFDGPSPPRSEVWWPMLRLPTLANI
jgi:hypothetical protein